MKIKYFLFLLLPLFTFSQTQIGNTILGEIQGISNHFGTTLCSSADGNIIAVSSINKVKVYKNINSIWNQIGQEILLSPDIISDGNIYRRRFSVSLSDDGSILAIGNPDYDFNDEILGQVKVYKNINNIWTQLGQDITGVLSYSNLGKSVSLSADGSIIAIGVPTTVPGNSEINGEVLVFKYLNDVWTQLGNTINKTSDNLKYGYNVCLSSNGSVLAIEYNKFGTTEDLANIDVFEYNNGVWTQIGDSLISDNLLSPRTPKTLDLSSDGNTIIFSGNNVIFTYRNVSGTWTKINSGSILYDNFTFNSSVSVSANGNIIAVGSYNDSSNEEDSGKVRVYENISGVWTQIGNSIDGKNIKDQFGISLCLSSDGSVLTVGSPFNFDNGGGSGQVRVFKNISGIWTQVGNDINGEISISNEGLGTSVSLSSNGKIIAIGGTNYDSGRGIVKIYKDIDGTWLQKGDDLIGDYYYNNFGHKVNLSADGNVIAINEPGKDSEAFNTGQIKVFKYIKALDNWTQVGVSIPGGFVGGESSDIVKLSADGTILAVGIKSFNSSLNLGYVRVYKNEANNWVQVGEDFRDVDLYNLSNLSMSLSSDGNTLALGMPDSRNTNSHVKIYTNQDNVWTQVGNDILSNERFDKFGSSVSLSSNGSSVAIGARTFMNTDRTRTGQTRIYKNENSVWTQVGSSINSEYSHTVRWENVKLYSDASMVAIKSMASIKIYKYVTNNWTEILDLTTAVDPNFFSSMSLSLNTPIIAIGNLRTPGDDTKIFSFESEQGKAELIDDIKGNSNSINITASQLNSIEGVFGAIEGVNYSTALDNGVFADESNPTASEIQAIINSVNSALSIDDNLLNSFKLFPNPVKDILNIEIPNGLEFKLVSFYNILSQHLFSVKTSQVSVKDLQSGIYFVEVETNQGKSAKKIVIE